MSINFTYSDDFYNCGCFFYKYTVDQIEENFASDIHPFSKLGVGSKNVYINGYEAYWDLNLSVSFNALECK